MKTAFRILAIITPVSAQFVFTRFKHLADPIEAGMWLLALSMTLAISLGLFARWGSGPRLVVKGSGWSTWDFRAREHGPTLPPGSYELRLVLSPTTSRPTFVLYDPEYFQLNPGDLVGQDEENLRMSIAKGQVNMKLCN